MRYGVSGTASAIMGEHRVTTVEEDVGPDAEGTGAGQDRTDEGAPAGQCTTGRARLAGGRGLAR